MSIVQGRTRLVTIGRPRPEDEVAVERGPRQARPSRGHDPVVLADAEVEVDLGGLDNNSTFVKLVLGKVAVVVVARVRGEDELVVVAVAAGQAASFGAHYEFMINPRNEHFTSLIHAAPHR